MTPYRFDNRQRKEKTSRARIAGTAFAVVALVLLVVFVIAPFVQKLARGPQWLAASVEKGGLLVSKASLIRENAELKGQAVSFQAQLLELGMLRDENEKLREELSYRSVPSESVTAQVIAKPGQSLYNSVIIDRGSAQGVRVGQLVTVHGTVGLGRVSETSASTATVQLFSAPGFKGDVVMKSQDITVPATGKGGGNFEIHIPREIAVTDGDILAFPESPNVAIGVIKSIIFDPRDPFQTVLARTPVNVQELRFVEVVK